jgi:hypothetical protein
MTKAEIRADKNHPLRIGFMRAPLADDRRIALASLPWLNLQDGSLAARLTVTSATAAAIRVQLEVRGAPDGIEARFRGMAGNGQIFAAGARNLMREGGYWSPILDGDTGAIELRLPPGAVPAGDLLVHGVGHLLLSADALKDVSDIGTAGACEHNVACVADPTSAVRNAARAVTQTIVTDGGFIVLCTATLLNAVPQTDTPYLMAAYHCYDESRTRSAQQVQDVANSMTTLWFFDAIGCMSNVPGAFVQVAGGATLLYRGPDIDFVLFRLNAAPPAGAWFSAWDATPVTSGTPAIVLHHAQGDLKKISIGATQGYMAFDDRGSYIAMRYGYGSTEAGSSGAALLTCSSSVGGECAEYGARGALLGGDAACDNMSGTDAYSRLDLAYPYIAQYLAPGTAFPAGDGVAVEFYNVDLDHFFITASAVEQNGIDHGSAGPGWFRTGYGFGTLSQGAQPPGALVCRFYGSVSPGPNSHFYTLDPDECGYLKYLQSVQPSTQPRWNYEGVAFWNYAPGVGGSCPGGTRPVHRYYNDGFPYRDSNHRFVASPDVHAFMLDQGWVYEGVAMCAPQ